MSSSCSRISLCDTSNNFFTVDLSSVFLMECKFVQEVSPKDNGCSHGWRHKHSPHQRMLVEIFHSIPRMATHYSQSGVYSFHEWNWLDRSLVFLRCLQINFDYRIPCNGFPVPVWEFWIWFESHATGFHVPGTTGFTAPSDPTHDC